MTDVSTRSRVAKGVSTGGRFSIENRPEAHAVPPLTAMTVPEAITAEKNAFFAAGGFEDGEHFRLLDADRSEDGTWTVTFADRHDLAHGTGDTYAATWHPERGYSQDDTTRGDYYAEHINPGRDETDSFAQDLLDVPAGQEDDFFRRVESQHQAAGD